LAPPEDGASTFLGSLFAAALVLTYDPRFVAAEPATGSQNSTFEQDAQSKGNDLTRPVSSPELRLRYQPSSGSDSTTDKERTYLLATTRIDLDRWWKLSLLAQIEGEDKRTVSDKSPTTENLGLGDSTLQAVLIRSLSERWAFGFGARVVAPTAQADLGTGKWLVMPVLGVRYSISELGSDSYLVPAMRYAVSIAGTSSTRDISELQIAPDIEHRFARALVFNSLSKL
jgi:Putative MetA-pathway of phenol degradation